jgi:hypothetical protein
MILYKVFETEKEALDAEAQVSQVMGFVRVETSHTPEQSTSSSQITERWDIPKQIADGRWVFVSPDNTGVAAGTDWWQQEELT